MEIIKVKNVSYAKYEEVLLRRDNLRKEAELYHLAFIAEFGDLIVEVFRLKVECIRKKKMIAYCQKLVNQGKPIKSHELADFIEKEMARYQMELESIISDVNDAKSGTQLSQAEVRKIKEIYYSLVKLIHPDMHPQFADDEVLKDYWQRIVIAYRHNQLADIEELDMLVRAYLEANGLTGVEKEIDDIESKIAKVEEEIREITTTDPYLYKIILGSQAATDEKKEEYEEEIRSFERYSSDLDEVLNTFNIEEVMS